MSAKSKARRERARQAAIARSEAALAIACPVPTCAAGPGVWCFTRGLLGPDFHERRYAASDPRKAS